MLCKTASVSALRDCCSPADHGKKESELCVTRRCFTSSGGGRPRHFVGRLVSGGDFRVSFPWFCCLREKHEASHLRLWACTSCITVGKVSSVHREVNGRGQIETLWRRLWRMYRSFSCVWHQNFHCSLSDRSCIVVFLMSAPPSDW